MNRLFEKQMQDILKNEYPDFMKALEQPAVKAFYLNPHKKIGRASCRERVSSPV